jgi:hypothetical protein
MEMLREYTCWAADLNETDAKIIKAANPRDAARLAVDSWRTEGMLDLHYPEVIVYVRDLETDEIQEISIKGIERFINPSQL